LKNKNFFCGDDLRPPTHDRVFDLMAESFDAGAMKSLNRLCPIALYIGRVFKRHRQHLGYSHEKLAQDLSISQQTLERFEEGAMSLDILFLLRLEKTLDVSYDDYKPPVSYFGFLGLRAGAQAMLLQTKQVIKTLKKSCQHTQAKHEIEDALPRECHPIHEKLVEPSLYPAEFSKTRRTL
jgi:transcriptional regulator with XRE-family HTH domain